jgi:ribosomal protein S18 acetylase RimI-like enzyme
VLTEISPSNASLLASATMQFRTAEDARTFAALDHAMAFVAEDAGTVTGYCWGYFLRRPDNSAMAYVHELEVAESHRRSGIGSGLMLAFLGAAQQRGATKVFLTTGSGNVAARSLYDAISGQIADQGDTTNYWWNLERNPQGVTRS